jgi:hypothetical protein
MEGALMMENETHSLVFFEYVFCYWDLHIELLITQERPPGEVTESVTD